MVSYTKLHPEYSNITINSVDNFSGSYNFPDEFSEDFASLDLSNIQRSRISGSVMDTITKKDSLLPSKSKLCVFDPDDLEALMKL